MVNFPHQGSQDKEQSRSKIKHLINWQLKCTIQDRKLKQGADEISEGAAENKINGVEQQDAARQARQNKIHRNH